MLPLICQPGEKWMYNTSAEVLGVLIARASGQPLETFFCERILEPLGMSDTGFSVSSAKVDRLATAYRVNAASGALEAYDTPTDSEWSHKPAFPSGGAGLVSTIDDYFAFGQMMLDGGRSANTRILSRPSIEAMTTDQITANQKAASDFYPGFWDARGWGFGMSIITKRDNVAAIPGRFGWDGGLGTTWYSDPTENMVTILMTQRAWTSPSPPDVCLDFLTLAYQAIDD
jgi:CubicO group peptidase (beta-lactamase class C family)